MGKPLIEVVREGKKLDWVVVEVSSYQLETVKDFRPRISIILNITEDHLDRYASMQEYAKAKFRIFEEQKGTDALIYNDEDVLIRKAATKARAKKISFSIKKKKGVNVWCDQTNSQGTIFYGKEKYPLSKVVLKGIHNIENVMSCIASARVGGCSQKNILKVLESFEGLPHRVQFVKKINGVDYFDDSKATNVDAVVRALEGFEDGKVVLIAGGRDKEGSYEPLAKIARKKTKAIILIGEAKEKMANALAGFSIILKRQDLQEAIALAHQRAVSGDVVLLSPACSSFDQFKDYKDRGDTFKKIVRGL
ncbi:MAG: UDP-N-acetylmuramoyl-L-alanine--D-glutamate ligase [Deltaproteobacteria bacterium]|nr:MAG: UDP-N-acetylmuramoyl-L-alanine--D-glutamate ligase [Deltaproteobacteria bacterium]